MVKRNKTKKHEEGCSKAETIKTQNDLEPSLENEVEIEPKIKKKKKNKSNKTVDTNILVTNEQNETEQILLDSDKKSKNKKGKAPKDLSENEVIKSGLQCSDEPKPKKPKKKKPKVPKQDEEDTPVFKKVGNKIIFVDNQPQEVPAQSGHTEKAKFLNKDEAEVKDEDIDRFCDEIDEEDNAQYEEWVKLVEAQLHSNKKKT